MHDGVVCWDAVSSQPRLHADGNSFPLFTLRAAMGNSGVLIGSMGTLFGFLSACPHIIKWHALRAKTSDSSRWCSIHRVWWLRQKGFTAATLQQFVESEETPECFAIVAHSHSGSLRDTAQTPCVWREYVVSPSRTGALVQPGKVYSE